jgi:hypothetical protein
MIENSSEKRNTVTKLRAKYDISAMNETQAEKKEHDMSGGMQSKWSGGEGSLGKVNLINLRAGQPSRRGKIIR